MTKATCRKHDPLDGPRLRHAANQKKYAQRKRTTHQRISVWVPFDRAEEFHAALKRMRRKWMKGGSL